MFSDGVEGVFHFLGTHLFVDVESRVDLSNLVNAEFVGFIVLF